MLNDEELGTIKVDELIPIYKAKQVAVWADAMAWCDNNNIYDNNKWIETLKDEETRKWKSSEHAERWRIMDELEDNSILRISSKSLDICNDIDRMYNSVKALKDELDSRTEMFRLRMHAGTKSYYIYKFRNPSKWMEDMTKNSERYNHMLKHFISLATNIHADNLTCTVCEAYKDEKISLDMIKILCDPNCKREKK